MAIAYESNLNRMLSFGKAFLHDGQVKGMEETRNIIMGITASDLLEVAREVLNPQRLSMLVFKNGRD
jgi:hypothetical protein